VALAVTMPLEKIKPTIKGGKLFLVTKYHLAWINLFSSRLARTLRMVVGRMVAMVATAIPAQPATRQPTNDMSKMLGPGATCDKAKTEANCALFIHSFNSTTCR